VELSVLEGEVEVVGVSVVSMAFFSWEAVCVPPGGAAARTGGSVAGQGGEGRALTG
jgi:hypothetical protein